MNNGPAQAAPDLPPAPRFLRSALKVYELLWKAARPCLARHKRLKAGFASRLAPENWAEPAELWIQAASGGEAYLVGTLLREAARDHAAGLAVPSMLLSTCTEQGRAVLEKAAARFASESGLPAPQVRFFPLDELGLMRRALRMAAPRLILLMETELWPGLLMACREAAVPVLVANGRLTSKSLRHYKLIPVAWWEYLAPKQILAISEADAARFAALFGQGRVARMPNLKFEALLGGSSDQKTPGAAPGPDLSRFFPLDAGAPLILFASTRKAEINAVLSALTEVRKNSPEALLILAPRHLHHAPLWRKALESAGLACKLRSGLAAPLAPGDTVLWDAFGELNALYARARAVFVGGSLAPLGGQNFLEPLAQGVAPIIGPFWDNFTWAADFVAPRGPARIAENAAEAARLLLNAAAAPQDRETVRRAFAEIVSQKQNGSRLVWAAIRES